MGRGRRKDHQKEQEGRLSRGANLATIAAVPLALVGLLFAYLALGGEEGSTSERAPGLPRLERIDLIARNGQPPARPALELMVHNGGAGSSVVSRARIEISRVIELPYCYTQGDLPASEAYGAQLPADASPGDAVETALHQQIGPGENDRFRIDLGLASSSDEDTPGSLYLFELMISLVHDGDPDPLPMGTAILSLPSLPFAGVYFLEEGDLAELERQYDSFESRTPEERWSGPMPCWQANGAALVGAGRSAAISSPLLAEAFRRAIVPSYSESEP